ncbi:wax ester/triacylglycerol synthase domain-containing protein [Streptomyces achromogenes]|uniref:wax ester/triacylglycerol synthase domain-containing protein n=1 Tax=Streptomyces achromogenes TaxID=67255 RepID=UPI0004C77F8F|nr:wax ester/triacylglycerol synthase domain-containing protein [Streptomyces achromogenes]
MNGTDTLFWRLSGSALTRPHVTWAWLLESTPDWELFVRACAEAVGRLPRLTHRVTDSPLRTGPPSWTADPDFRLSRHVHRVRLPAPGGPRELLDMVEWRISTAFDPLHPPWEITLAEDYETDRAAVVLKWHHSLGDAVTIVGAVRRLMENTPPAASSRAAPLPPPGTGTPAETSNKDCSGMSRTIGALVEAARTAARSSARVLSGPGPAGDRARSAGRTASQLLPPASPSPLLAKRSSAIDCGMMTVSLAELKAAGKRAGVSVTSAYVSAVLGAFHRYHDHHGLVRDTVPVLVPVSFREAHETGAGNLIAGVLIAGPIGDMSARSRMVSVHTAVAEARGSVAREVCTVMADMGALVPEPLYRHLAPTLLRRIDVVVTSVPGLPGNAQVAGSRVVNAVPWAPRGGAAANISMASHGDLCGIGTNLDPAAITDARLFHHFLEDSFEETLGCARHPAGPPRVNHPGPPRSARTGADG